MNNRITNTNRKKNYISLTRKCGTYHDIITIMYQTKVVGLIYIFIFITVFHFRISTTNKTPST